MAWQIDNSHSEIQFTARHMMISKVRGIFPIFSGTVELDVDNPAAASVDVTVDVASINTRDEQRDGHLRSPDFFDVEVYPEAHFRSTDVQVIDDTHAKVTGNLTIRNVTKPLTLNVEYQGMAKSPWGAYSAGFSATGKLNRKDWDLNWNQALETGGVLVSDEISLNIEVELVKQEEAVAE
ncbi:MAG: YceI family protein [Caldilineaceae bacterium]|nr:YceI family protein [Caldilineaceae bacterium]